MSTMNVPRILVGGLIAGLIMNIGEAGLHAGVLGDDAAQLYERLRVPAPDPAANIPMLVGVTFLVGLGAVWLYAAIRPRFGAGPRTALLAGLAVWLFAHLWSGVYLGNGYPEIITPRLAWIPVVWGFFEATLATVAGAALYKER
jgi:hypothetical protein